VKKYWFIILGPRTGGLASGDVGVYSYSWLWTGQSATGCILGMHNETPVADRSQRTIGGGYIRAYIRESEVVYCEIFNEFLSKIQLTIQAFHH